MFSTAFALACMPDPQFRIRVGPMTVDTAPDELSILMPAPAQSFIKLSSMLSAPETVLLTSIPSLVKPKILTLSIYRAFPETNRMPSRPVPIEVGFGTGKRVAGGN
jgi:hypothetical protein